MLNARLLSRTALVLFFVVGAWEDILPGMEHLDRDVWDAPLDPLPSSDADDDAGDGYVLAQVPLESVLMAEQPPAYGVVLEVCLIHPLEAKARLQLSVRRIPHVPIPPHVS